MVEVNIQFLAGVAVTVFLALMFFGVVVLWDVALAIRSIGDKIDKLEDNVDDDLTEIGHSLDGMSNGGGGGTQLHLSGGTISSGPNQGHPQQGGAPGASQQATGTGQAGHSHAAASQPQAGAEAGAPGPGPQQGPARPPDADQLGRDDQEADDGRKEGQSAAQPDSKADGTDVSDAATDTATDDADTGTNDDEHPRASINRHRFVTSPYLTPWYAVALDREATGESGPQIAGALEAGRAEASKSHDVFAAAPGATPDGAADEDGATDADDPIVATAPGDERTATDDADTPSSSASSVSAPATENETSDSPLGTDSSAADATADESGLSIDRAEDESAADSAQSSDRVERTDGNAASSTADDVGTDRDATATDDRGQDVESTASADESGARDDGVATLDVSVEVNQDGEEGSDAGTNDGTELSDGESTDDEPTGGERTDGTARGPLEDHPDGDQGQPATERDDAEESVPLNEDGEPITEFELSDVSEISDDSDDVSVEDAVDTMNDETPSLSLASHDFEVTAEADDESASLRFEFDPASVELTGSTRRLLRYQLRSFGQRESTPAGDVTVEGQTLLIELPDPDGNAIQRWGEAAVSVIDRTLYLSDDSD